jgi:hypothetical protein
MHITRTQPAEAFGIPVVADDPLCREALEQQHDLVQKIARAEAEIGAIETTLPLSSIDAGAAAILRGETPDFSTPPPVDTTQQRRKLLMLRKALEFTKATLTQRRGEVGRRIAVELRPQYGELVRKMAEAAIAFAGARMAEVQFRDEANGAGVSCSTWPPMLFGGESFDITQHSSNIRHFVRELVALEYMTRGEMIDLLEAHGIKLKKGETL